MTLIRAYFDDSGTHYDSEVVVMGGLIGTLSQWRGFEADWATKLASPAPRKPALKMFHLSHCSSKDGEFRSYSQAECDLVTHDFRRIIEKAELISTASAIDRGAWDELVVGRLRDVLGPALVPCFINCIDETISVASVHPEGRRVEIIFDQGIECERLRHIADLYTRPLGNPWIASITFANVRNATPLQGADMSATETYWHAKQWLREGDTAQARAHFQAYMRTIRAEGLIMDRRAIEAEVQRRGSDDRVLV
jgi:hypothetical protein